MQTARYPDPGAPIDRFTTLSDRAIRGGVHGEVVYWLQQDGDDVVIWNTRCMEGAFQLPRFPLSAARKYGTTIDEIVQTISLTEGVATIDAAKWPNQTIGVMFTKETR